MKRNLALVGLVLMLACQETPMEPNSNDSGLAGSGAQVDKILHARFPISNSQFWACTNEIVDFEGEFLVSVRQTTSASGNTTFRLHVSSHVKGVGQTSGDEYVSNEVTNLTDHTQGDRFSDVFQFRIVRISKGGAENSAGWIKFHLTIDDGVVKIIKDDAAFDVCRG
jgi:hypothetical protein